METMQRTAWIAGLVLAAAPCLASGSDSPLTTAVVERRNAAAGFVGTLKFTVGRTARVCRDLLGEDDAWMRAIVDDWMTRNERWSQLAEVWTSAMLTAVLHEDGDAQAQAFHDGIRETIRTNAEAGVEALLGVDDAERMDACKRYAALVGSGALDITPQMEHHATLVELDASLSTAP
jgi:hypothetical protein